MPRFMRNFYFFSFKILNEGGVAGDQVTSYLGLYIEHGRPNRIDVLNYLMRMRDPLKGFFVALIILVSKREEVKDATKDKQQNTPDGFLYFQRIGFGLDKTNIVVI